MAGHGKIQRPATTRPRIVNLNAIDSRGIKFQSKGKIASIPGAGKKMDYTKIHKENVILEENLEDHLINIKKNERKTMEEKGEEMDEMRKQMEVITKLQEAVNSRAPGDTTDLLSINRIVHFGRLRDSKLSQAQMKIDAERSKFSSKNMFNVRRNANFLSFESTTSKKRVPSSSMQAQSDNEDDVYSGAAKDESLRPKLNMGYLKNTFSSMAAFRPLTANVVIIQRKQENDILPPRSKSAILRSRSRRELELLCRVAPKENEPEITADFQIDWKVINEKRRRRHLQELKVECDAIQGKVCNFLKEVELFNKRSMSVKRTSELSQSYVVT